MEADTIVRSCPAACAISRVPYSYVFFTAELLSPHQPSLYLLSLANVLWETFPGSLSLISQQGQRGIEPRVEPHQFWTEPGPLAKAYAPSVKMSGIALNMPLSSQWWRSKLACSVLVVPHAPIALDLSSELAEFEYTNGVNDQQTRNPMLLYREKVEKCGRCRALE